MRPDIKRRVIQLLHGGHALEREAGAALINELGPEGLEVLRGIADGQIPVEHPQLRLKAISALGLDETEPDASARVLSGLVNEGPPRIAIHAIRALGRLPVGGREQLRGLVRDPATPPAVALAAARVAAHEGGEDVAAELRELRRRLRAYVETDDSPSLLSIDRLISEARHGRRAPDGPRPIA